MAYTIRHALAAAGRAARRPGRHRAVPRRPPRSRPIVDSSSLRPRALNTMNMCTVCAAGPAAERRARSARARRAVARSDRDGPVRKRFSDRTVAVRRCERPVKCVSCVYLCPVPGPRTLIFRLPGADKHALLELLAALASLLWQRPAHPTHRPARGRPRQAFLPLWPVVCPPHRVVGLL
jgi:hypothetical protein